MIDLPITTDRVPIKIEQYAAKFTGIPEDEAVYGIGPTRYDAIVDLLAEAARAALAPAGQSGAKT